MYLWKVILDIALRGQIIFFVFNNCIQCTIEYYSALKKDTLGWGCGSSDRGPAYQAQSTEFKPEYHQKKDILPFVTTGMDLEDIIGNRNKLDTERKILHDCT
jgi:hypothetical protein